MISNMHQCKLCSEWYVGTCGTCADCRLLLALLRELENGCKPLVFVVQVAENTVELSHEHNTPR